MLQVTKNTSVHPDSETRELVFTVKHGDGVTSNWAFIWESTHTDALDRLVDSLRQFQENVYRPQAYETEQLKGRADTLATEPEPERGQMIVDYYSGGSRTFPMTKEQYTELVKDWVSDTAWLHGGTDNPVHLSTVNIRALNWVRLAEEPEKNVAGKDAYPKNVASGRCA